MITEGAKVEWINARAEGKSAFVFRKKIGYVLSIDEVDEEEIATIVYGKNRRRIEIAVRYLRELDE